MTNTYIDINTLPADLRAIATEVNQTRRELNAAKEQVTEVEAEQHRADTKRRLAEFLDVDADDVPDSILLSHHAACQQIITGGLLINSSSIKQDLKEVIAATKVQRAAQLSYTYTVAVNSYQDNTISPPSVYRSGASSTDKINNTPRLPPVRLTDDAGRRYHTQQGFASDLEAMRTLSDYGVVEKLFNAKIRRTTVYPTALQCYEWLGLDWAAPVGDLFVIVCGTLGKHKSYACVKLNEIPRTSTRALGFNRYFQDISYYKKMIGDKTLAEDIVAEFQQERIPYKQSEFTLDCRTLMDEL